MVPELLAEYGFSYGKAAPRPPLFQQTDKISNCLARPPDPSRTPPELTLSAIADHLARSLRLPGGSLSSCSRRQRIAFARQLAMYLGRKLTGKFYPVIGRCFGRHHASVIGACRLIEKRVGQTKGAADDFF